PTAQTLADGRSVTAASSMAALVATLRANGTTSKDTYVIAAASPFRSNGYVGISPGGTILGETTDLSAGANNHDDLALAFMTNSIDFDSNTIAHEAGHCFGLQHAVTTSAPSGSAVNNQLPTSEIMSYLSSNSSYFFSRFPMVRGDSNTDPNTSTSPPTPPPLLNSDLEARQGQQPPFDQLRVDPNIGENPALHYISGTGAHDIITITKGARNTATVSVQAFRDSGHNLPIIVPGTTGTTY